MFNEAKCSCVDIFIVALDHTFFGRPADGLFVCIGKVFLLDQHPIPVEEVMVGPPGEKTGASGTCPASRPYKGPG